MLHTRRKFIVKSLTILAAIPIIGLIACEKRKLKKCVTTDDMLGPFYRESAPFRTNLNATNQTGTFLAISGIVYGKDCKTPVSGATVDIWHADNSANYDNTTSDFNFRGKVNTDSNGKYEFTSLVPGRYLNGSTYRPSHIHFRITADKHKELTTQLYFSGDPYINSDPWASDEDADERIITLTTDNNGNKSGTFDIKLMPS